MLQNATFFVNIDVGRYIVNDKIVGKLFKEIRESKNFTQEDVAKTLNIGRNAIVRIEQGTRKISADELLKLEKLYNIELDNIFGEKKQTTNIKGIILAVGIG